MCFSFERMQNITHNLSSTTIQKVWERVLITLSNQRAILYVVYLTEKNI